MPEVQSRSYANPRRLPRRNHYQEGPGFLFVATQGGRPPEALSQRAQATVVRRRRAALRRWADGSRWPRSAPSSRGLVLHMRLIGRLAIATPSIARRYDVDSRRSLAGPDVERHITSWAPPSYGRSPGWR